MKKSILAKIGAVFSIIYGYIIVSQTLISVIAKPLDIVVNLLTFILILTIGILTAFNVFSKEKKNELPWMISLIPVFIIAIFLYFNTYNEYAAFLKYPENPTLELQAQSATTLALFNIFLLVGAMISIIIYLILKLSSNSNNTNNNSISDKTSTTTDEKS